ncbi:hypothetical protein PCANB_001063 [Pneumocystis canis]|nr:hypothetical protein PCANB_001063 [Pneumocystis canis]
MVDDRLCRVCCGESSEEEPLFYPCKCSGTIKYVHDNCLIKWLQHSRRKDCELCRTPFRFTKLYDPNMPKSIPVALFLVRLLKRLRRLTLRWLRTALALFLWLGWLPWITQCAWKFSLKLGDSLVARSPLNDASWDSGTSWLQYTLKGGNASLKNTFKYKTIKYDNQKNISVDRQLITGIIVIIFIIILLCREWVLTINLNNDHHFESLNFDLNSYNESLREQRRVEQESLQEFPSEHTREATNFCISSQEHEQGNRIGILHSQENHTESSHSTNVLLDLNKKWEVNTGMFSGEKETDLSQDSINITHQATLESSNARMIGDPMNQHGETSIDSSISINKSQCGLSTTSLSGLNAPLNVETINTSIIEDTSMGHHNVNAITANESSGRNRLNNDMAQSGIQENAEGGIVHSLSARVRNLWNFVEESVENREQIIIDGTEQEGFSNAGRTNPGIPQINLNQENDDMPDELGEIDGIIELSGIRGPISGLLQNCTVTSILIAVFLGLLILIPYVLGKSVILVTVRIPHYLIQFPESMVQKVFLTIIDAVVFSIFQLINSFMIIGRVLFNIIIFNIFSKESFMRIFKSHTIMKSIANNSLARIRQRFTPIYLSNSSFNLEKVTFYIYGIKVVIPPRIITLGTKNTVFDRTVCIIVGYCILIAIGALYLKKHSSVKRNTRQSMVQRIMNDTLQQAEVIIFPIYCGILIDLSLLDLFENASISTRLAFTNSNPFTSYFLHWFIGTAYMFQFALFVKMCRDIVRPGVLFFIHDPNDAQFHPIKEILERPIKLQLRKIFTSGIIYSCLICSCFSSVIYSTKYFLPDLFPLHLSIKKFLFGIPFDILALHILIPLTLKLIKPAIITKAIWLWWLKTISAKLRLTSFMFNGRHPQEEGVYVRKTFMAKLLIKKTDIYDNSEEKPKNMDVVFVRNGSFLRVPFKDNIPLHRESVFIPVTEDNVRLDKKQDNETKDSPNFTVVYVPPSFIKRIIVFLFLVWIFAFMISVMLTIPPLIVGRQVFAFLFSGYENHDFYTYIFGCYFLGILFALSTFLYTYRASFRNNLRGFVNKLKSPKIVLSYLNIYFLKFLKMGYMIFAFKMFLPILFGLVMDYYIIIPFNTYFFPKKDPVVHLFHDWALGILYILIIMHLIMLNTESSLARSMSQIIRNGYMNPDIVLSTKLFILPFGSIMIIALLAPLGLGYFMSISLYRNADYNTISHVYRYSYPLTLAVFLIVLISKGLCILLAKCKQSIRDEVYLIGKKLHNYNQH